MLTIPRIQPFSAFLTSALLTTGLVAISSVLPAQAQTQADDPYLWLEQLDSPAAMQWVRTENEKTLSVLEKTPHFADFYRDALAIGEARDRIPMPRFLNGKIFNFWQDAEHIKGIWRSTGLGSYTTAQPQWKTVLDLDALSSKEKANWVWKGANCANLAPQRCMLSLSDGGEDAVVEREFDTQTGSFVPQGFSIPRGKTRLEWQDKDTLLVAREWQSGELTTSGYPYIVKRVKRGQSLDAAQEVFRGTASDGGYGVSPAVLHDAAGHRALLIVRPLSTFESETYLVTSQGAVKLALPLKSNVETLVQGQLIVRLDQAWAVAGQQFAQGSLVALDLAAATRSPAQLKPVLVYAPGPRDSLGSVSATRNALLLATLDNVRGRLALYSRKPDGTWSGKPLALPDNASIDIVDADWRGSAAFMSVTGFLQPSSLWLADAKRAKVNKVKEITPKFDASQMSVEQREATSTDGVKIPYFVLGPKNMKLDGNNPTIINAYGGFNASSTPYYHASVGKLWSERGGVFVVANIRGGGEFGPAWHEAGLKTRRQIIYNDFVAVANDLIARKVTSPKKLGIQGGSNGGLLMGVQFTQHPELWSAVDIQVPLLDMLRFEQIAAGPSWVGEYGSVSVPEERAFLASISPYANIKRGVQYPQPLVWTTTKDDRVGPQHARKFAARLSEYGIPYYFYEVTEGGHGAGANLKDTAHTTAIEMSYFTSKLMDR